MTLVIGQPGPLASQVCTLYLFNFLRFFQPDTLKGSITFIYTQRISVSICSTIQQTWLPQPLASQALWPPKFPSVYLFNFHDRATHKLRHNATIRAAKTGGEIGGHRFQSTNKYFGNCQNQMSLVCCMPNISVNLRCRVVKNPTSKNIFLKQSLTYNFNNTWVKMSQKKNLHCSFVCRRKWLVLVLICSCSSFAAAILGLGRAVA